MRPFYFEFAHLYDLISGKESVDRMLGLRNLLGSFDYLKDIEVINETQFQSFYNDLDELSRMLFSMIKSLSSDNKK